MSKQTPTAPKPSVHIAMPCYDSVKINTMLSVIKLIQQLSKSGIEVGINTMKSPLIHQARNYLTSVFLTTKYQYLLFIDSDVEFEPESVLRMLVAKKEIICTPYRVKAKQLDKHIYTVEFKDPKNIPILPGGLVEIQNGPTGMMLIDRNVFEKIKNKATPAELQLDKHIYLVEFKGPKNIPLIPGGLVEIESGPTGLMLIDRMVFEKIITNHPQLKIKNKATPTADKSHEFYYNFFNFGFSDGYSIGEDVSFCRLAKENDFKIYANTESTTKHHGSWAWEGKFGESLNG